MKVVHYLDFSVQALLLGGLLIVTIASAVMGELEAAALVAFYVALLLGPWQLVSSVVMLIAKQEFRKLRVIHVLASAAYIGIVIVVTSFLNSKVPGMQSKVLFAFASTCAGGLAFLYFFITYKTLQHARGKL